jgi:hypothetical protein
MMCGLRSLRDQMRCTEVADTPACFAIVSRLQRVLGFGGRVASVMTRATLASGSEGLRPRPGSSSRPSKPCRSNRFVHVETRLGVVPSFSAAAVTDSPSSRASTISARSRSRTVLVLARDRRRNSFTTSASAAIRLIGRAIRVILPRKSLATQILVIICRAGH